MVLLTLLLHTFWVGLVAEGMAFGLAFLSFTLTTGEGGMIWLCQISFAGLGAVITGQLAGRHGWPVLLAIFVSALIVIPFGLLIGLLTVKLGELYVALVTLTSGFLIELIILDQNIFVQLARGFRSGAQTSPKQIDPLPC